MTDQNKPNETRGATLEIAMEIQSALAAKYLKLLKEDKDINGSTLREIREFLKDNDVTLTTVMSEHLREMNEALQKHALPFPVDSKDGS